MKRRLHPNILVPRGLKETDFFSKLIERNRTFIDDYLPLFPGNHGQNNTCDYVTNDRNGMSYVRAEASPNYLVHPYAAARIKKYLPRVRIIVMLRGILTFLLCACSC